MALIVFLIFGVNSGAHTLGRCHEVRSGFDGPWTHKPLVFDNEYYKNLVELHWQPKKWDGKFQYEDVETGKLMMLPTDIALIEDPVFRAYVELYASNQAAFFKDFSNAYGKLLALGCPPQCDPFARAAPLSSTEKASAEFRELAMHGSVIHAQKVCPFADVNAVEATSNRTALHKAAFWGHEKMCTYLLRDCKVNINVQDYSGDTALHDAARFGHKNVAQILVNGGINVALRNKKGQTAKDVAVEHSYHDVAAVINPSSKL